MRKLQTDNCTGENKVTYTVIINEENIIFGSAGKIFKYNFLYNIYSCKNIHIAKSKRNAQIIVQKFIKYLNIIYLEQEYVVRLE